MSTADTLRLILLSSLWGYLLLDETLSLRILVGMVITLAGTAIATRMIRWRRPQVI